MGEGRPRASHNNISLPVPVPTPKLWVPATLSALTQVAGPGGPQAAAESAGGACVARSVPAAPLQRVPPPAPAPAAAPPLPVPLPLRQMASGSPAPARRPPPRLRLFTFTLGRRSLLELCSPAASRWAPCFVLSPVPLLPVLYASWASVFPTAASLNPAFLSLRGDGRPLRGTRDNVP